MGTNPASSQSCVPKLPGQYNLYILLALKYKSDSCKLYLPAFPIA